MYTNLKSYQIIIALLKKYNIRHLVLSAGSRNVPFVHSVEEDAFFTCYSVVDERSAAYFAIGLSQQLQEPVLISCTASTASSNYWPAIGEAFYQNTPIVVLTSDRNPSMLHQWEDQMIDQVGMFDRHVKKSVNLPIINDEDDWLFCQRLVNEALLELNHNGSGPVHINVPMKNYCNSFNYNNLPEVTKIERINFYSDDSVWIERANILKKAEKILITCGQRSYFSPSLNNLFNIFFQHYNCAFSVEHMSNVDCDGAVLTTVCMDTRFCSAKKFKEYVPDIVISFGLNVCQGIKEQLRNYHGNFEHWSVIPDGSVCDMFLSLTHIFECPIDFFFSKMNAFGHSSYNNKIYYNKLNNYANSIVYPSFDFCQTYAIQQVIRRIPEHSILHLAINNSIRIANFFKIKKNITTFANIGTYGIDGCLSTFIGQATATNELCFLFIGDLAFFYDMNALRIVHIGKNLRILLVNNQGGGEFYYNGSWLNKSSDLHTTARHHTRAEGWVKENNFIYLSAYDKESLEKALSIFMDKKSDKSIFLEVFTEMKNDSDKVFDFYNLSRPKDFKEEIVKNGKNLAKSILPNSIISIIKK